MADEQNIHVYPGDAVDVSWDGRLCIHVGECGRSEGELFVGGRNPWCDPNLAGSADRVAEVCQRCPTGALTYVRKDGGAAEVAPGRNQVVVANDGPLYFTGALDIDGAAADQVGVKFRAALCRCGASKNKPFCDNSHRDVGFEDHGAVGSTGDATSQDAGAERAAARQWQLHDRRWVGARGVAWDSGGAVSLWGVEEQAVLRRLAQAGRVHGGVNRQASSQCGPTDQPSKRRPLPPL